MFAAVRDSLIEIISRSARSSSVSGTATRALPLEPRGNLARGRFFSCVIVVSCDHLVVCGKHYLQKSANSQHWNCRKMQIGEYLRAERERLGLTQTAMSKAAGVAFRTYCDYEAGKSEPKASTLVALREFGVDALYVLTGQRTPSAGDFSHDEIELVSLYRSAPLAVKAAVLAALTAGNSASSSISVSGQGNRVAGRDYNENKK